MSRHPNCWCGETTIDPWCPECVPDKPMVSPGMKVDDPECCACHPDEDTIGIYDPEKHCPTCHSDNMWAHGKPCYYCGEPINNLAGNPSLWNVYLCQEDDPGRIKPHHIGCVSARLQALKRILSYVGMAETSIRAATSRDTSGDAGVDERTRDAIERWWYENGQ